MTFAKRPATQTHHPPMDLEKNGPASIIMLLEFARQMGKQPDLAEIERLAKQTLYYMQAIEQGHLPKWHETGPEPLPEIDVEDRYDKIYRAIIRIHAVDCDGNTLDTLPKLARMLAERSVTL